MKRTIPIPVSNNRRPSVGKSNPNPIGKLTSIDNGIRKKVKKSKLRIGRSKTNKITNNKGIMDINQNLPVQNDIVAVKEKHMKSPKKMNFSDKTF